MKVEVKAYQEKWPQMFEEEAHKLKGVFGDELLDWIYVNILDTNSLSFHCLLFNRY